MWQPRDGLGCPSSVPRKPIRPPTKDGSCPAARADTIVGAVMPMGHPAPSNSRSINHNPRNRAATGLEAHVYSDFRHFAVLINKLFSGGR
ncbi:hypothetical protein C7449_104125 [Mycoplana dimorpha]|uniref:Uncharacterized protein n=1 Tax=Mycoplana dimorpha TaxID=28320 RepID=A0A2T5B7V5_MYCDI|nr:hypothetical protein C7449_104125 [Mycoplana dimorpha]